VETREFCGTASASNRVFPHPASATLSGMKYLIPVLVTSATITAAITSTVAQGHGAFAGQTPLRPYLFGYACASVLLLMAGIFAIITQKRESQAVAAPKATRSCSGSCSLLFGTFDLSDVEVIRSGIPYPSGLIWGTLSLSRSLRSAGSNHTGMKRNSGSPTLPDAVPFRIPARTTP